ncbi:MAG: restriction endonuclease subunit S [Nocardioidaceae bacterium]|nr:restriction endonuclease subunit S [Nocardioidaceae bacterium]
MKTHEQFRPTSLEWLEVLPSDWDEREIGREVWVRARLGWKGLTASEYVDNGVPMLATPDIKGRAIDYGGANRIPQDRYDESPEIMLREGDVLLTKDGSTIGTVNVVRDLPEPATVNGSIAVLTPTGRLDGRYLYWFIASTYAQGTFDRLRGGMGVPHLFQRDINRIRLPFPRPLEQRAIADFLDRETTQIDTLIEEQQRLIELLRERRSASIARSTGWDHSTADWTRARLSWLFDRTASGTTPANADIVYSSEAEIPWVTTGELREEVIIETQRGVTADVVGRYSGLSVHPSGSLLIAMYGATIGRTALLGIDAASNQACCALVGPIGVDVEFVQYSLSAARERLLLEAVGGGQPNINQEKIRSFRIPVPSLIEQRRIVADLKEKTEKIDSLIAKAEQFIELSRERRAALITAAVTGQIDVRDEVA